MLTEVCSLWSALKPICQRWTGGRAALCVEEARSFLRRVRAGSGHRDLIVHNLWAALESVLDMRRYIVGRGGTSTTGVGAQDLIEKAREAGVLEPPLAARLQDMVSLRDAILHEFWRLDC